VKRAVEEEFGEPLADIIAGLRAQGNTWRTVAGVLGVNAVTLYEWRKKLTLPVDKHRVIHYRRICRPVEKAAKRLGYESLGEALRDLRLHRRMTHTQVAARLGVNIATITRNLPPELKGMRNISPEGRARWRQRASGMRRRALDARRQKGHAWQRDNDSLFIHAKTAI